MKYLPRLIYYLGVLLWIAAVITRCLHEGADIYLAVAGTLLWVVAGVISITYWAWRKPVPGDAPSP